jgi:septum formation protein
MQSIILASGSKRRSQILSGCGIKHRVFISNATELLCQDRSVVWNVIENARRKAFLCAQRHRDSIIISADTLVVLDRQLIGKPKNKTQAKELFKRFSGKRITVVTGLCVQDLARGRIARGSEKSFLYAKKLKQKEIDNYFLALKPYDKAGGFSIEGIGSFIYDDIRGSYFNILGLPMIKLKELFSDIELNILDFCT